MHYLVSLFIVLIKEEEEKQQTTMTAQMHVYSIGYHSLDDTLGYILTVRIIPPERRSIDFKVSKLPFWGLLNANIIMLFGIL